MTGLKFTLLGGYFMHISKFNAAIIGVLFASVGAMATLSQPIGPAKAVDTTVSLVVVREESLPAGDHISLTNVSLSSFPSIQAAIIQADKNWDTHIAYCNEKAENCQVNAYKGEVSSITFMPIEEAKLALTNLAFHDIPAPGQAQILDHGIHVGLNGKYYAIAIAGI